jgi:hypothetical protein
MARGARLTYMRARQRKRGGAVVECRSRPGRSVVTDRTLLRKTCLHMAWIGCAVVVREMT